MQPIKIQPIKVPPIQVLREKSHVIDFLKSEEGNADRRKVMAAGAVLAGSVLAQTLLVPNSAYADCYYFVWDCSGAGSIQCANMGGSAQQIEPFEYFHQCHCICP